MNWKKYSKAIVAAVGVLVSTGLAIYADADPDTIPENASRVIEGLTLLLTVIGVYAVPNIGYGDGD